MLRTNENSWPFLEPVTEELAPNYFSIIEVIKSLLFLFNLIFLYLESNGSFDYSTKNK